MSSSLLFIFFNFSNSVVKFIFFSSRTVFKCGKCEESFETGQQLQRHLRTHEQALILERVTEKQMKKIKGKADRMSKRIEYECYLCNCIYKKLPTIRRHMNLHVKNQKAAFHYCSICRTKVERTKLNFHVCGQQSNVQCEYCSRGFKGTNKLLKHLDVMHKTTRRLYECEKCFKHFPMIFLRDFHQNTHTTEFEEYLRSAKHKKMLDSDKARNHLCEECGKRFTNGGYSGQKLAVLSLLKKKYGELIASKFF